MQEPAPHQPSRVEAIEDLIFQGKKIAAIKLYRETTGQDLAQAKKAIEDLEAALRSRSPDRFAANPKGEGCSTSSAALFLVALTTSIALAYLALA